MADSKITALTSISTSTDPANDPLVIVDVSDTSMAATGTTKKVTLNQLLGASGTATLASATITGNLTVNGNGPHRFGTSNYSQFDQSSLQFVGSRSTPGTLSIYGNTNRLIFQADTGGYLFQNAANTLTLLSITNDATQVTLNSTGLGLGVSPVTALSFPIGTNKVVGQSATSSHAAGNVGSLKFGIADGGGDYSGIQIFNTHNGTYSSQDIRFFTGEGGVSVCTERMRITPSGNVGIGVTPTNKLDVSSSDAAVTLRVNTQNAGASASNYSQIQLSDVGTVRSYWRNVRDGAGTTQFAYNSYLQFLSDAAGTPTERMRLDASGNLLVGKTANYGAGEIQTLQLKSSVIFASDNTGSASNRNWSIGTNVSGAGNMEWTISSTNTGFPNFAYRMQLTSAGAAYNSTGTWGTISDSRLKENISDARNYLADLLKLRVVKYSLKEEASAVATKLGLIAQEVEQVFPSLVEQSDVAYEGGDGIRTVKTSILVPMLLKAIQELTARVQTLETR